MKKRKRWIFYLFIFFLKVNINSKRWQNVILIGDFNTVFTELDLASEMVFKTDKGREELVKIMRECNFIDVWRERNRTKRKFSRMQVVMNKIKQSRIDYVLCNEEMEGNIKKKKKLFYKEVGLSDHFFLCVKLDLEWKSGKRTRGMGFKCNNFKRRIFRKN